MIKNNKGVTLVELLIVIIILGIIAAVSIPAVGSIVENAEKDTLITEAANIRSAANNYCVAEEDTSTYCDYVEGTSGADDYLSSTELSTYIQVDDIEYAAWKNSDGEWEVAMYTTDYYYVGTIADLDRDAIQDVTSSETSITDVIPSTAGEWGNA